MARETNIHRINRMESFIATVIDRVDRLRDYMKRMEATVSESAKSLPNLDKQFAVVVQKVVELEQKRNKRDSRRWDLWLLVLGALVSGMIGGLLSRPLDRWIGAGSGQSGPVMPAPG